MDIKMLTKGSIAALIALSGIISVIVSMYCLTFIDLPPDNKDLFNQGFGAQIAWATMGVHYFLGSSKGSKDKTAAMAKMSAI